MRATITIDTKKAEKILRDTGRRVRKSNFRMIARNAAKIVQSDLEVTAPIWDGARKRKVMGKSKYHLFSRKKTGYRLWIKRGNLRKSMKTFTWSRSKLLWVGSRYGEARNGMVIGMSKANSDGFYDKWVINGSGGGPPNNYITKSQRKIESRVRSQLIRDGEIFIDQIAAKANATP